MSLRPEYFDELYNKSADPWGFSTRWYEQRKYALTLAALPHEHYRMAFEPGCSIGVLTAQLARRCDHLLATDPSGAALTAARRDAPPNVEFALGSVPDNWPAGTFDLIIFSELGYYLSSEDLDRFIDNAVDSLESTGHLIAAHWRPQVADYPGNGAAVHRRIASAFSGLAHYEDEFILLDVFGGERATLTAPE